MRLTLRALLAYLDDVLEPKTLRELGARISESSQASATIARIREVVRRRRIAAPELTGSGSAPDPNLVAEYLDNTLDPHAAPALETMYLESDMHLAEVASSHQILSAVLGEPIEVPVTTRERMYALVMAAPPVAPSPGPVSPLGTEGVAGPAPVLVSTAAPAPRPIAPDYLKSSGWRSLAIGLLVLVLGGGWIGWVLKEQGFLGNAVVDDTVASTEIAAEQPGELTLEPEVAPPQPSSALPPEQPAIDSALAVVTPAKPEVMLPDPQPVLPTPEPALPNVAAPSVFGLTPQPELSVPAEAPERATFPAVLYGTATGVLLTRSPEDGQWIVMPRRTLLHEGDEIACPEPFEAHLQVAGQELLLTLHGGTRVQLASGTGEQRIILNVDRGRITLSRPSGSAPEPFVMGLNIRGQAARLSLGAESECGVEVGLRVPHGRKADLGLGFPEGGLVVRTGSVGLAWRGSPEVVMGTSGDSAAWPIPPEPLVAVSRSLPPWLNADGPVVTAAIRRMNDKFEQEFTLDQPVSVSMPALVSNEVSRISELATYTLGLVDDTPSVVRALQSKSEETRLAAIHTLRGWLPTAPENAGLLEHEVSRYFPDEDVATVTELLWGYSEADARDPAISRTLVDHLGHRDVAIREIAIFQIKRLTGRDRDYHANVSESMRNPAWMRWKDHLDDNNGSLLK